MKENKKDKKKEKKKEKKSKLARKIKAFSIKVTLFTNLLYIAYLAFSLFKNIGIRFVNIALLGGTAVFLLVYLVLQLFDNKGSLKNTKRFYKRFKLVTKLFTTGTAIYSLVTAAKSVSPIAKSISIAGAILLAVRILIEILVSLIEHGIKKLKETIKTKWAERKLKKYNTENIEVASEDLCSLDDIASAEQPEETDDSESESDVEEEEKSEGEEAEKELSAEEV